MLFEFMDRKNGVIIERLWPERFESQPIVFGNEDKKVKKFTLELHNSISGNRQHLSPAKGSYVSIARSTNVFIEIILPLNTKELQNA